MKQLTKLGSQEARVLTDDQMRNILGELAGLACTPSRPGMLCPPYLCETQDISGNIVTGICTANCVCYVEK